jgi:NADH-quinone oxidoreductase subunit M
MLPLLVLMVWMGTYTQSFIPPISAENTRILDQSKAGVDFRVDTRTPRSTEVARAR